MSNPQRSRGEQTSSRGKNAPNQAANQTVAVSARVTAFAWHQFVLALVATIAILCAMAVPVLV